MGLILVYQNFELLGIYLEAFCFGESFFNYVQLSVFSKKIHTTPQDSILAYLSCIYI